MKSNAHKELTAIYEISKVLASSPDLNRNLRAALAILSNFFNMSRGIVAIKKDNFVEIFSAYGLTKEEIKRGKYKLGEGVIGKVAKQGTPIVIPDIKSESIFLNKTGSRKHEENTKVSFICVPIKIKNEILGVLSVDKHFDGTAKFEEDLRLLKIIASLFAINIKLSSYFESEMLSLIEERELLRNQLKDKYKLENIIGQSEKMQQVFETVHRIAKTQATLLLLGESGTGKELIAKSIHFLSDRSNKPFVKVNCAAIPEGLIESELFGHEKGAFTGANQQRKGRFELADKGTIFLDEIGEISLSLQAKLLRVLQEREFERVGSEKTIKVDVRVIAATNRNLEELVSKGEFRQDLFFRLNVIPIYIPPLRERREDILPLIEHFTEKFNKNYGKKIKFSDKALNLLINYNWPGNVRELENTIERLTLMAKEGIIRESDLPANIKNFKDSNVRDFSNAALGEGGLPALIDKIERENIKKALNITKGNRKKAAYMLGITERQINYKINKLKITV